MKAFADYKSNVVQMMKFVLEAVENIIGEEENSAG